MQRSLVRIFCAMSCVARIDVVVDDSALHGNKNFDVTTVELSPSAPDCHMVPPITLVPHHANMKADLLVPGSLVRTLAEFD